MAHSSRDRCGHRQVCITNLKKLNCSADQNRLALYDIVIYIDDSGSMAFEEQGERIKDLELILQRVAFAATLFDEDGYVGTQRSRQKNVLTMNVASRSAS